MQLQGRAGHPGGDPATQDVFSDGSGYTLVMVFVNRVKQAVGTRRKHKKRRRRDFLLSLDAFFSRSFNPVARSAGMSGVIKRYILLVR